MATININDIHYQSLILYKNQIIPWPVTHTNDINTSTLETIIQLKNRNLLLLAPVKHFTLLKKNSPINY